MKTLRFTLESKLTMDAPVNGHSFALCIEPGNDPSQQVNIDECLVDPVEEHSRQQDGWGNLLYVGSSHAPHDHFAYRVSGTAQVDSACGRGTELNQSYRFSSPLTQAGPALRALLQKASPAEVADASSGDGSSASSTIFSRAVELRQLVHGTLEYRPGSTDVTTTAEQAASQKAGVCQDFAHVLIALLRASGIPARYVSGLMWGEGATHAWAEFYDGTTWWGMDPTNDCEAGDYYIALARGRDAADCPVERGVFKGTATQSQQVNVIVEVLGD